MKRGKRRWRIRRMSEGGLRRMRRRRRRRREELVEKRTELKERERE